MSTPLKTNPPAKLTIVETVYHQLPTGESKAVESKYSKLLDTTEEPFSRRLTLDQSWKTIEYGWISEASTVVLENLKPSLQVVPTPEEAAFLASQVIEVSCTERNRDHFSLPITADWIILPGESLRATPKDVTGIRLRAAQGNPVCRVTLFPK